MTGPSPSSSEPPSFTLKAGLTTIGYALGYFPGLIMNFMFLAEAKRVRATTKHNPPGMLLLDLMLFAFFWLPLLVLAVMVGLAFLWDSR